MSKIVILGNSVSLKVRPPAREDGEMTYAEHLIRQGFAVVNRSRAASMINEAFRWFDEDVLAEHPDILILQFGAVEACSRRHPRWLSNAVTKNNFYNRVVGRNYEFATPAARIRRLGLGALNQLIDRLTAVVKIRWRWLDEEKFIECLRAMVTLALKDTPAHVYVMGVSPCDERIQRHLPGSMQNIEQLNKRMAALVAEFSSRVSFVDVFALLAGRPLAEVIPDGIHFSAAAHRLVGSHLGGLMRAHVQNAA